MSEGVFWGPGGRLGALAALIRGARVLAPLFPPGFPWLRLCLKYKVAEIRLVGPGGINHYLPKDNVIELAFDAAWSRNMEVIEERAGIRFMDMREYAAFTFLHELAHHLLFPAEVTRGLSGERLEAFCDLFARDMLRAFRDGRLEVIWP